MAIDKDGNLILSCPNFADLSMPSCVLKIDKDRNIKKWFDVPLNEYSGEARAMGIEFGPDGICTWWTTPAGPGSPTWCSPGASSA